MLDTTKHYSLIPVWMTLMFSQGHRFTGSPDLVQSFFCKVARRNWDVHDGYYVSEVTVKSGKYGEFGSFEHLFFSVLLFVRSFVRSFVVVVVVVVCVCVCVRSRARVCGVLFYFNVVFMVWFAVVIVVFVFCYCCLYLFFCLFCFVLFWDAIQSWCVLSFKKTFWVCFIQISDLCTRRESIRNHECVMCTALMEDHMAFSLVKTGCWVLLVTLSNHFGNFFGKQYTGVSMQDIS